MGRRKLDPSTALTDELRFREFVLYKLGQHDMALKILITLTSVIITLLIYLIKTLT